MCRDFIAGNLEKTKTYPDQQKKRGITAYRVKQNLRNLTWRNFSSFSFFSVCLFVFLTILINLMQVRGKVSWCRLTACQWKKKAQALEWKVNHCCILSREKQEF